MGWKKDSSWNGQEAKVKRTGDRIEAISPPDGPHDHIASNDGVNANYLRIDGVAVVDDSLKDAYDPNSGKLPKVANPPC